MVSLAYIGAVAVYFLVLYPYIIQFVSWAVWAIEGLPPPSYQNDFKAGRLVPSSSPYEAPHDARVRMREEVRRMAKDRAGEEKEKDAVSDCPLTRSKSWLKGQYSNMRRTRLDKIMGDVKAAEEGQSAVMEEISLADMDEVAARTYYPNPSVKGKERAYSPPRSFSAKPKVAQRFYGVGFSVYMRILAGHIFFHSIFCALPFWFKFMNYSFTQQMMLPFNMHDQD